jgi:hypothetical protein
VRTWYKAKEAANKIINEKYLEIPEKFCRRSVSCRWQSRSVYSATEGKGGTHAFPIVCCIVILSSRARFPFASRGFLHFSQGT